MTEPETITAEVEQIRATSRNGAAQALREPFDQVQKVKKDWIDKKTGQPKSITLDYIGHAVVTDRLLSVDPAFQFEPLLDATGRPIVVLEGLAGGDQVGVWGRLTILGSPVVEFCSGKDLMDAYSRCLCRAAMRRGVALDLWIKDDEFKKPAVARQEGPGAVPVPKSWAKVKEAVEQSNERQAWPIFEAFTRAASYHLYGETDSKKLTAEQRKVMLQKAGGAAVALHEQTKPEGADFVFFDVPAQRAAWASVLDGTLLEIPDYTPPDADADRIGDEVFEAPE